MESQSSESLPIIYQPFDANQKSHWKVRGCLLDFFLSTQAYGKRVLDFGPGDGWPSLIMAPYVEEIIGVEGSKQRVEICTGNAEKLEIRNVQFVYVEPGSPLPFEDGSFDAVVAASSIEQSPNPRKTLEEFYRLLRPGGRMRLSYESFIGYRNGREQEAAITSIKGKKCKIILYDYDRHIDEEKVDYYGTSLDFPPEKMRQFIERRTGSLSFTALSTDLLEKLRPHITDARICTLTHPSGTTMLRWVVEIGFGEAKPSYDGGSFAAHLFSVLEEKERPRTMNGIDSMLKPIVKVVIEMIAPLNALSGGDPMITAIK